MTTRGTVTTTTSTTKYGVDNLTYDLVACMYEKSKGLEAYQHYMKDAQGNQQAADIFRRMQDFDRQCVSDLEQCLKQVIGSSK